MAKVSIGFFLKEGLKQAILKLIRGYQIMMSPFLGYHCRFDPTCSQYSFEAINRFGILKGGYLSLIRLLKCHPFHPGGKDVVLDR